MSPFGFGSSRFYYYRVSVPDAVKEIKNLSRRKATQSTDIPVKSLKKTQIFLEIISVIFSIIV